jgi:hypothetical protein
MIVGIYGTLGVFLILAARDSLAHRSLVWFTVWSSVVHGGIMAVHALAPNSHGHLLEDVPGPVYRRDRARIIDAAPQPSRQSRRRLTSRCCDREIAYDPLHESLPSTRSLG